MKSAPNSFLRSIWIGRVERLFLIVFAALTLLMPLLYLQVNYFIVALIALAICGIAAKKYQQASIVQRCKNIVLRHPVIFIFLLALLTRVAWVIIISLNTNQVSDFLDNYHDSLVDVPSSRHVPNWTHFITYPYLLHPFVNIFGHSYLVGGIFNAITCSVSITLTYLLGAVLVNKRVGLLAAILMILWPSVAVFTSIYAPDHLSISFMLLSILCFIKLLDAKTINMKIVYGVGCAISLWALGFFKDLTPVLVIAFVLILTMRIIMNGRFRENLTNLCVVLCLCVLALFSTITHIPIISAIADRPVNPSLVPYFIYIGLGGNNTGSWQPEIMTRYDSLIEEKKYNYEEANKIMLREALHSVKQRTAELPTTIWNKNKTVQATDEAKITWVEESARSANSHGLESMLRSIVQPLNGVYFAAIIILICAAIYSLWSENRIRQNLTLLIILCIGYSTLLLIIEAQNRYRYIIEPLYCIVAAYGVASLYSAYFNRKARRPR